MEIMDNREQPRKTAKQLQQELAELYGARNITSWDVYTLEDREYVLRKLLLLIPNAEVGNVDHDEEKSKEEVQRKKEAIRKENIKLEEARNNILNAIWNQRKYNGGDLLMSLVYILCTKYLENENDAFDETEYSLYALFRIRKCRKEQSSENCCMIFIDYNGRVYQNWNDYLQNNTLPEGIIVAPHKGCYDFNENNEVQLDCAFTPASSCLARAVNWTNQAASYVGLGAGIVTIGVISTPVLAPAATGAAVAGLATGMWNTASSYFRLRDRATHEESVHISDSQARSDWFGLAGGVFGMGASGATSFMAGSAAAGTNIPNVTRMAVNGLNIANILVNGVSVGNTGIQMILNYLNGDDISVVDILQLSSSLFLITHSVYNFRTANQIVKSSQDTAISNARQKLSIRQKKGFNRAYKETLRLRGEEAGKADVLRSLNNMPEFKQPLNDINKVNQQLNQNGLRASLSPDGRIILNNDVAFDSGTIRQNLQHGIGENIASRVAPAPTSYPAENLRNLEVPKGQTGNVSSSSNLVTTSRAMVLGKPAPDSIGDAEILEDCINLILEYITSSGLKELLKLTMDFHSAFSIQFSRVLSRPIHLEEVLWRAFRIARDECTHGNVEEFIFETHPGSFLQKIKRAYKKLIPQLGERSQCTLCEGLIFISSGF